jgi:glucokinase
LLGFLPTQKLIDHFFLISIYSIVEFAEPVCNLHKLVNPMAAIGLDVGANRIKAVVVENDGTTLEQIIRPTQPDAWMRQVADLVNELLPACGRKIQIGVCAPGVANRAGDGIWNCAGKVPGLEGLDWQKFLCWEKPIPVMNDAQAALLGESWLGAAAGRKNAVLFTLGTGVGGAAIVDGVLLRGALGRAGHFGHISISPNAQLSIFNTPGSLEDAFGNLTLKIRSKGRFCETADLLQAVVQEDADAVEIWDRAVSDLARGIVSVINALDPEIVVLGGGIAAAGESLLSALKPKLDLWEWRPGGLKVELELAALGEWAGAYGAARQAMKNFF